jgi:hypothetical protein
MEKKAEAARNQAEDIRESVVAHKIDDKKKVRSVKHTMEKKLKQPKTRQKISGKRLWPIRFLTRKTSARLPAR